MSTESFLEDDEKEAVGKICKQLFLKASFVKTTNDLICEFVFTIDLISEFFHD